MSLDVQSRQTDAGVTVLAPSGRLDVTGAPSLKDAVSEAVKNGQPRLVIDLEGVIHDGLLDGSPPVAGLLGAEILNRHHGIIDFGTRTLYLKR